MLSDLEGWYSTTKIVVFNKDNQAHAAAAKSGPALKAPAPSVAQVTQSLAATKLGAASAAPTAVAVPVLVSQSPSVLKSATLPPPPQATGPPVLNAQYASIHDHIEDNIDLKIGDQVTLLLLEGDWATVRTDTGLTGYFPYPYLRKV